MPTPPSETSTPESELGKAYLSIIKRAVTGYLQLGHGQPFADFSVADHYDPAGQQWKIASEARPQTLLSGDQLDLIERCILHLQRNDIPGDLIEAGVWRGGAIVYMRAILHAHGIRDRQVIAADSFAGIPLNKRFRHDPVDQWQDRWQASMTEVQSIVARYGLLDDQIEFLPGLFEDSLPTLSNRNLALMRLDSDSYNSVMTSLEELYPRLAKGGIVIVDDWHLIGCRFAVNDFRDRHEIREAISVDAGNGWWIKE